MITLITRRVRTCEYLITLCFNKLFPACTCDSSFVWDDNDMTDVLADVLGCLDNLQQCERLCFNSVYYVHSLALKPSTVYVVLHILETSPTDCNLRSNNCYAFCACVCDCYSKLSCVVAFHVPKSHFVN